MKTSVIDVRDMLSVLSVQGVEERIGEVPRCRKRHGQPCCGNGHRAL